MHKLLNIICGLFVAVLAVSPLAAQPISGGAVSSALGLRSPYIGYVSNNTNALNGVNLAQQWIKSDELHYAKSDMPANGWAPCYANWYVAVTVAPNNGTEQTTGAGTVYGWVDYPVGVTKTPITFSASSTGTFGSSAQTLCADMAGMPYIPQGAAYRLRQQLQSAGGIPYLTLPGDAGNRAESGTGTGNLTANQVVSTTGALSWAPVKIIGYTTAESYGIIGDSRAAGTGDTRDQSANLGQIARTVGQTAAYAKTATPSDRVNWMISNFTMRCGLLSNATKIIQEGGINDILGGRSAAQLLADLQTSYGLSCITGKPIAQTTFEPISVTSSDGYITEANQTPGATNAVVQAANNNIRAGTTNVRAVVDTAAVNESPTKPGVYAVVPDGLGAAFATTGDGSHLNQRGELRNQSAGPVRAGM